MPAILRPRLVLALLFWAVLLAWPAAAQTRDLSAALARVPAGGVLELPAGDWGELRLEGTAGPSVIRSADPADPARLSGMELRGVEGLTLDGLLLKYDWDPEDRINVRPFQIFGGGDIRLTGIRLIGDEAGPGTSEIDRGYPWGTGLFVRGVDTFTLEGSELAVFHRGVVIREAEEVTVRANRVHGMRSDGINIVACQGVLIEGNHIHDFDRSVESTDHADMIQFWTNKTNRPSTDVVIRGNLLNSGAGDFTQSIFMRNEEVDNGRAGREMFYRNFVVEDNFILNAHRHGISIGEVDGLVIRRNTILHNPMGVGARPQRDLWLPRINVPKAARNVRIEDNIAAGFPEGRPEWQVGGNLTAQPHARMKPGHYATIFESALGRDPSDPTSYRPLPGGPADRLGLGAAWPGR
ncbi:MAG: right-handed parallel beta-helix repeat-containing protein [Pseudomonadota bacterium]